jgi:peptidoglycan/LPS O-acetylase OafA/YrhL
MTQKSSSEFLQSAHATNGVYFPALDGIRALALAMVFLNHYADIGILGMGVDVFFVLSGFLITGILLDTRDQPHRIRNFYVRRTLRIFPLYYGVFFVLLLLMPVFHWRWNSAWPFWPAYLGNYLMFMPEWLARPEWMRVSNGQLFGAHDTVLQLGHFWTLCFEEQFYLLWPWFVFSRSRKFLLWFCGVVIVLSPILRVIAAYTFPPAAIRAGVLFRTMPFQSDALLWGALLALLLRGAHRDQLIKWGRVAGSALFVSTLAYLFFCVDLHIPGWHSPLIRPGFAFTWHYTVVDIVSGAVILASLQPGSWIYNMFHLRPLRWLGRISYGAYVFHNIPHGFYGTVSQRIAPGHVKAMAALIAIVMTLILASLSYRFFETPFLRLKYRWTGRT